MSDRKYDNNGNKNEEKETELLDYNSHDEIEEDVNDTNDDKNEKYDEGK